MQYETCHSPVVSNGLPGPIDRPQGGAAMGANSATCWLEAEHTVPTAVQVPLEESFNV